MQSNSIAKSLLICAWDWAILYIFINEDFTYDNDLRWLLLLSDSQIPLSLVNKCFNCDEYAHCDINKCACDEGYTGNGYNCKSKCEEVLSIDYLLNGADLRNESYWLLLKS